MTETGEVRGVKMIIMTEGDSTTGIVFLRMAADSGGLAVRQVSTADE